MPSITKERLLQIDSLLRGSRGHEARVQLRRLISQSRVPRELAWKYAWLCWRADCPQLGVRLLRSRMRPDRWAGAGPSDLELAEYSQCLIRLGARSEAEELLRRADPRQAPRAYLYRASIAFARWDYREAIPHLLSYLRQTKAQSYENLLARVNLAAAYVEERRTPEAEALLRELLHETSVRRVDRLYGNVLELSAQFFIGNRAWKQSDALLARAECFLGASCGVDGFFVRKWRAILLILKDGASAPSRRALDDVRQEASRNGHWETVRECDRYEMMATHSVPLFYKLFFGTPFARYREKLCADWKGQLSLPSHYVWKVFPDSDSEAPCLEVEEGQVIPGGRRLKPGQSIHRTLMRLSSDFYRPVRAPDLFQAVFRGERYNPTTSARRVYQALQFLRGWIEENSLPLEVEARRGEIRLLGRGPCQIVVTRAADEDSYSPRLRKLETLFAAGEFTTKQASGLWGTSERMALRELERATHAGVLAKLGSRSRRRYRFLRSPPTSVSGPRES